MSSCRCRSCSATCARAGRISRGRCARSHWHVYPLRVVTFAPLSRVRVQFAQGSADAFCVEFLAGKWVGGPAGACDINVAAVAAHPVRLNLLNIARSLLESCDRHRESWSVEVLQVLASHRIASHRIASHRIASHRIASHRIASHRIASYRVVDVVVLPLLALTAVTAVADV